MFDGHSRNRRPPDRLPQNEDTDALQGLAANSLLMFYEKRTKMTQHCFCDRPEWLEFDPRE